MAEFLAAAIAAAMAFLAPAPEEPAYEEAEYYGPEYYEESYYEPYYEETYYEEYYEPAYEAGSAEEFMFQGVVYEDGTTYTWYSENVLPGGGLDELNANGRHVDESTGFVMDGDGYIAVASSDLEMGEVVETPWGEAKVYDTGCASGVVDVYVAW